MSLTKLSIQGLKFYGHHGVPDAEQEVGHHYELSCDLWCATNATLSDLVDETVDYGELASHLVRCATGARYRTVERLATVLLDQVLSYSPIIAKVKLTVTKLSPPIPFGCEGFSVEVEAEKGAPT